MEDGSDTYFSSCEDRSDEKEFNKNELEGKVGGEKLDPKPEIGMKFSSENDVYVFYTNYARREGFGVLRRSSDKKDDGKLRYFRLACARSGKPIITAKNSFKPNPSIKTQCKAKINAVATVDGMFKLNKVVLEHNHLLSPGKARYFRSNKKLDPHVKRRLELNDQAGIRVNKNFNSFVVEAGGYENLTFGEKDCRNYIEQARRLRLGTGDAEAILKYFSRMQDKNSNFFYLMDVNDEGRLRNVFWADARSRAAYEAFGDVVTFDTTYLTNKYDMPFAPFVGVNHHGQSILLGCGLLSNEDIDTFVWLFDTWLTCMSGRPPNAIITGQCKAMQRAIQKVFPNARHRWCIWHIMKKCPEKLGRYSQYEAIRDTLHHVVYDLLTPYQFEERWERMIEKYDIHDNEWLRGLYDERRRWVPVYVKDTFWAGMSSTQRRESMNAFFDGYVNSKTTLKQFIEQYANALKNKVEKESQADFNSFNSMIPCITHYKFETQFQEAYTNAKFKEFQDELRGKMYCEVHGDVNNQGSISTYEVVEELHIGKKTNDVIFNVYFNDVECEVHCICRLFEFRGILCRHVLALLTHKKVKEIPPKYILTRWRKDLKRWHTYVKSSYDNLSAKPHAQRFDKLRDVFYEVGEIGANSDQKCDILMSALHELKDKILNDDEITSALMTSSGLHSPLAVRSKGRPPSKRKESKVDQIVRRKRQKKMKQQVPSTQSKGSQKEQMVENNVPPHIMLNTLPLLNEIGTQESVNLMANPNSLFGSVYEFNSSTLFANQSQGRPSQFWSGYGMGHPSQINLLQAQYQFKEFLPTTPNDVGTYSGQQ